MGYVEDFLKGRPYTRGGLDAQGPAPGAPPAPRTDSGWRVNQPVTPMPEPVAAVLMGLIYATALGYVTYMYYDFNLGWTPFFSTWAGLTVAQWIFRPVMWLLIAVFGIALLVAAVVGVAQIATIIWTAISAW